MSLKYTQLHAWHQARGAKLADFGGWDMPIEYAGVLAEHTAVRESVGVFDVSHMGKLRISGVGAAAWLDSVLVSDIGGLLVGKAQYSMLLNEAGGVVDDLIVYRLGEDELWIVPNASNVERVVAGLNARLVEGITIENRSSEFGIVAVQGPKSPEVMRALGLDSEQEYMSVAWRDFNGAEVLLCRSGYTGETGFEVIAPNAVIESLWEAVITAGAAPCGLGARDTLRLEMAYPLHGHEISEEITPVQALLSWAIAWDKPGFVGSDSLRAERESGPARKRVALKALERGIPRADMPVIVDGKPVGLTSSGTFSPTLSVGIALALVDPSVKIGDHVELDVRGRRLAMEVVKPPFVQPSTK